MNPIALSEKVEIACIVLVLFLAKVDMAAGRVSSADLPQPLPVERRHTGSFSFGSVIGTRLMLAALPRSRAPELISYSVAASCGRTTKARIDTKVRVSLSMTLCEKGLAPEFG